MEVEECPAFNPVADGALDEAPEDDDRTSRGRPPTSAAVGGGGKGGADAVGSLEVGDSFFFPLLLPLKEVVLTLLLRPRVEFSDGAGALATALFLLPVFPRRSSTACSKPCSASILVVVVLVKASCTFLGASNITRAVPLCDVDCGMVLAAMLLAPMVAGV